MTPNANQSISSAADTDIQAHPLRISVSSSRGSRQENQDCLGLIICSGRHVTVIGADGSIEKSARTEDPGDYIVAIVCDGMGGLLDGAEASRMVVNGLLDAVSDIIPSSAAEIRNLLIVTAGSVEEELMCRHPGSGTTLSAVIYAGGEWMNIHLGDSRTYAVYDGGSIWRSADHSPVEQMFRLGMIDEDEMNGHPMSNVVSKYIGGGHAARTECDVIRDGWKSLTVCSDGAFGYMDKDDFISLISGDGDAEAIVRAALENGSRDNVSVIRIIRG